MGCVGAARGGRSDGAAVEEVVRPAHLEDVVVPGRRLSCSMRRRRRCTNRLCLRSAGPAPLKVLADLMPLEVLAVPLLIKVLAAQGARGAGSSLSSPSPHPQAVCALAFGARCGLASQILE